MFSLRVLPLLLLLGCDTAAPRFVQVEPPSTTSDSRGPYRVTAAVRGAVDSVQARYALLSADGEVGEAQTLGLRARGDGRYEADVPGQVPGSVVTLTLVAEGPGGSAQWPPDEAYLFQVLAPTPCGVDGDCPVGALCDRETHLCKVPPELCTTDGDCPQDRVCDAETGVCRFRPSTCAADADCGPGRVCEAGLCVSRPECVVDADCPVGASCLPPGRCGGAAGCDRDADCPPEAPRCFEGACTAEPCPGGCPDPLQCIEGLCQDVGACGGPCPPGLRCAADLQRCVACTADGQCGAGQHCDVGSSFTCQGGARLGDCTPCGPMGECGFGQACILEQGLMCATTCENDRGCPRGSRCDAGLCRAEVLCGGVECRRDEECEGACLAGVCTPRQTCGGDADCAAGWLCRDTRCLPEGPPCFGPNACPAGELCVGGRCTPGAPEAACQPCQGFGSCPGDALCLDVDGTGTHCVAFCGREGCPGQLQCLDAGPFGVCLTPDATCQLTGCGLDVLEPNNEPGSATAVPVGGTELLVCRDDADYLMLPPLPGGRARLEARTGRVDAQLFHPDGSIERGQYGPGEGADFVLAAQPQILRITTSEAFEVRYSIGVFDEMPACDDDFLEDNDSRPEATILGNGADVNPTACAGDADWFRLRMRPGERGSVRIEVPQPVDPGLSWALEDGTGMALGQGLVRDGAADLRVTYQEVLLLHIDCDGCNAARYRITTRFEAGVACDPDALEPNNAPDAARAVGVPFDRSELTVCTGDEDWYQFSVPAGVRVRLDADFAHARGDVEVEVFDTNGQPVDASTGATDNERIDLPVRRRPTDYLARIYLFPNRGDTNTYRLRLQPR